MNRRSDIDQFYYLLGHLEMNVDGKQQLKDCDGYMDWQDQGVYFFFAPGRAPGERGLPTAHASRHSRHL